MAEEQDERTLHAEAAEAVHRGAVSTDDLVRYHEVIRKLEAAGELPAEQAARLTDRLRPEDEDEVAWSYDPATRTWHRHGDGGPVPATPPAVLHLDQSLLHMLANLSAFEAQFGFRPRSTATSAVTPAELEAFVRSAVRLQMLLRDAFVARDAEGVPWMCGVPQMQWLRKEGNRWVPAEPPPTLEMPEQAKATLQRLRTVVEGYPSPDEEAST